MEVDRERAARVIKSAWDIIVGLLGFFVLFVVIINNIKCLFKTSISITNPFRQALIYKIICGIPARVAADIFGMSMRAVKRILKEKKDNLAKMKFVKQMVKECNMSAKNKKRLELAIAIIDEIIPMVSGRSFRVQKMTNLHLYKLYKAQVAIRGNLAGETDKPMSLACITKRILKKWNIHHSLDAAICPTCRILEDYQRDPSMSAGFLEHEKAKLVKRWKDQNKKNNTCLPLPAENLEKCIAKAPGAWKAKVARNSHHHQRIKDQFKAYKQTKDQLAKGELPNTILLLQDFTQLQPQSGFNQDLIISILSYDPQATDKLKRTYLHFIADNEKNDVFFVFAVWEYLLVNNILGGTAMSNIVVWSDGGPKHFKLTDNIYYFSTIKERYNINLIYNFY